MGELKVAGSETANNSVSADVLIDALKSLQSLVLLAAAELEGQPLRQRFKPSALLRQRHNLRCAIPSAGSYAIAVEEWNESQQNDLGTESGLSRVYDFVDAIVNEDSDSLRTRIPSEPYRTRMLRVLHDMAPAEGARWWIDFTYQSRHTRSIDYPLRRKVGQLIRAAVPVEEEGTVIGELIQIKFDENKIYIKHPVTLTRIECSYTLDIEENLIESRRDLVLVTGSVTLGSDLNVIAVADVSSIEPVDLTPFELDSIDARGVSLRLDPPLLIEPALDEDSKQYFIFDDEELDLHVAAPTRERLVDEIADLLAFSWSEYAVVEDDQLSAAAVQFKNALVKRLKENT